MIPTTSIKIWVRQKVSVFIPCYAIKELLSFCVGHDSEFRWIKHRQFDRYLFERRRGSGSQGPPSRRWLRVTLLVRSVRNIRQRCARACYACSQQRRRHGKRQRSETSGRLEDCRRKIL